jgi:hypothetical protein
MKKRRGRPPKKPSNVPWIHKRIRFEVKDLEKIELAAARRGMGSQEFIRLACVLAAEKVFAAPPDEVLGRADSASSRSLASL